MALNTFKDFLLTSRSEGRDNEPITVLGVSFLASNKSDTTETFNKLMELFDYQKFIDSVMTREILPEELEKDWGKKEQVRLDQLKEDIRNSRIEITVSFKNIVDK